MCYVHTYVKQAFINVVVITIVAIAAVVFARTFVGATMGNSDQGIIPDNATQAEVHISKSSPVNIKIPQIGVDATVERVGLLLNGAMGNPSTFKTVGWYAGGINPGNPGTAFIDGHVDNGLGLDGVFKRLSEVRVGDELIITRENGEQIIFEVLSLAEYSYDSGDVMTEQSADDYKSYIKLITCGGKWLKSDQTYDKRVVVTAKLLKE